MEGEPPIRTLAFSLSPPLLGAQYGTAGDRAKPAYHNQRAALRWAAGATAACLLTGGALTAVKPLLLIFFFFFFF